MLRSDDALEREVAAELAADRACCSAPIEVRVNNGHVTLSGVIADAGIKTAAVRAVKRVYGVDGVHSRFHTVPETGELFPVVATLPSERSD
jgi:osmotically-inducible protein OsmY